VTENSPDQPPLASFPARYARTARFTLGSPRNLSVIDNGRSALFTRSQGPEDSTLCLWRLDTDTGIEHLVVDPATLTSDDGELPAAERARRERARESASGIVGYSTDANATLACFTLGGSLFIVDLASGEVTSPEVVGPVFDPRPSPDGSKVAYVSGRSLRFVDLETGSDRELRGRDDPDVSYGRAEFVAAEEMGRSRGYWWSPESDRLLVTTVDESPVNQWWISDPAQPATAPTAIRYPAAGSSNASIGLELVDLDGSGAAINWNEDDRYEYLASVIWRTGHRPIIVRQTRDQRRVSIAELHESTGSSSTADLSLVERHVITDETWVELIPGSPRPTNVGLFTIEDDAVARRLMLDGTAVSPPTIQVRELIGSFDNFQSVVVTASTDDATETDLWTGPANSSGDTPDLATWHRLTAGGGINSGVAGGSTLVVSASSPNTRGLQINIHRPSGFDAEPSLGPTIAAIDDNSGDAGFAANPHFAVLGSRQLNSAVFLPSNHDGQSRLPVLLDPYGGPHAQRVVRSHNQHLVSRWFAEQGMAVVVTDGRGTPGRGPVWEREVANDLANPVLEDQIDALDAALTAHPELDGSRVAIRGWSFGGFLAALAVLQRPDRFAAAIAGAPVTAWDLYDTHYTERYLGHPDHNRSAYTRSGLWVETDDGADVPPLTRPLLLIHGLADDNVVAAHTLRFSNLLLANGSPHRVLPLVGVSHMTPQHAVAENLLRFQLDFLKQTVFC